MKNYVNEFTLLSDSKEHPEIYVACLDSYNEGNIHGAWINATKPVKDILREIAMMQYEGYHGTDEMSAKGYCPDGHLRHTLSQGVLQPKNLRQSRYRRGAGICLVYRRIR
jgi:hypothetical protein